MTTDCARLRTAAIKARAALSELLATRDPIVYADALRALDQALEDAPSTAATIDVLAEHSRAVLGREWVSVGAWLLPGEVIAHMDDPRPTRS